MKIEMSKEDFGTLCICALRYCHGRRTYMPGLVIDIVERQLKDLPDSDIKVMWDDCRFMNASDYGDEFDRARWIKWQSKLCKELERREGNE